MKQTLVIILLFLTTISLFPSCDRDTAVGNSPVEKTPDPAIPAYMVTPLKWYGGKTAAVSIIYDTQWGHWKWQPQVDYVVNAAFVQKLGIYFEFVTDYFTEKKYEPLLVDIRRRVF